jgi:hypothetical protein
MEQSSNADGTNRRVALLFVIISGCLCSMVTFTAARTLGTVMICLWLLVSLYVIWYKKHRWLAVVFGILTLLTVFGPVDVKFTGTFSRPTVQEVYTGPSVTPEQHDKLENGEALWYGYEGIKAALAPKWLIIW